MKVPGKKFKSNWIARIFEVGSIWVFQSGRAVYAGESINTKNIQTTEGWNRTETYNNSQVDLNPGRQTIP